jgi:hypothetical protein
MLHARGQLGGEGDKLSGGLHGVGVSAVNALGDRLELELRRGGKVDDPKSPGDVAVAHAQADCDPAIAGVAISRVRVMSRSVALSL